jgi:hypothetical protein
MDGGDWFGISRGPDLRPCDVKAAAERISIGHNVAGFAIFLCTECQQSDWIDIKHRPECETGKILDAWARGHDSAHQANAQQDEREQ